MRVWCARRRKRVIATSRLFRSTKFAARYAKFAARYAMRVRIQGEFALVVIPKRVTSRPPRIPPTAKACRRAACKACRRARFNSFEHSLQTRSLPKPQCYDSQEGTLSTADGDRKWQAGLRGVQVPQTHTHGLQGETSSHTNSAKTNTKPNTTKISPHAVHAMQSTW